MTGYKFLINGVIFFYHDGTLTKRLKPWQRKHPIPSSYFAPFSILPLKHMELWFYLRQIVNGIPSAAFVFEKSYIVLRGQQKWSIARKELVEVVLSAELIKSAIDALQRPNCSKHCWCDDKVPLRWIKNPDLLLAKFIARRIDVISQLSRNKECEYCATDANPADVVTRPVTASTSAKRMQLRPEGL